MEPIFEEAVICQMGIFSVPLPSVEKCQEFDELELSGDKICHPGGLGTLLAFYSNADVCCSDHVYIVGTISHSQREGTRFFFKDLNDFFFVGGGAAVADGLIGGQKFGDNFFGVEHEYLFSSNFI